MEPTFKHTENNAKGAFDMIVDGQVVGHMTYSRMDEHNVIIDHTSVDPSMKGKGMGKLLVEHAVEWARANNQKVLPLCSFAKLTIERNPEMQDILRK